VHLDPTRMSVTVEPVMVDGTTPGWQQNGEVTVHTTYPYRVAILGLVVFDGMLRSRTTERVE
jgi:hypothetical protein